MRFDLNQYNADMEDGNVLGMSVWWTVPDTKVTRTELKAAVQTAGLDEELIPKPSYRRAMRRVQHWLEHGVDEDGNDNKKHGRKKTGVMVRKVKETVDEFVLGVVQEGVDQDAERLDYQHETTYRYVKPQASTGNLGHFEADGPLADDIMPRLHAYMDTATDTEIRAIIMRVIRLASSVALRPSGGVYFVPSQHAADVAKLDTMLRALGAGKVYVMRVPDGPQERAIAWEAAQADIETRIDDLIAQAKATEKRLGALRKKEAAIDEMRDMVKLYERMTGYAARIEEVEDRLNSAANVVATKIAELQQAKAAKTK